MSYGGFDENALFTFRPDGYLALFTKRGKTYALDEPVALISQ